MSCFEYSENYMWLTTINLGKGAFGMVYKGVHKYTGEEVAVKTFAHRRPEVHMREFEVMKVLCHKNIVKLLAIEEEVIAKKKVLIMELCRGGSLQNILDDPQNAYGLEESEFLCVLKDLSAGLKYLRDNNIIHRDLKPANIMKYKTEDGCIIYKLADFGSARYLEDGEQYESLHGTEEYLHPILYKSVLQQHDAKAFKANTDLWSVGVTIYQMATSSLPFKSYGGRRNRDTMLYILNNKKSGVISGIQFAQDQPIVWSTELPQTCLLNQGLRNLITVLLVHILECDPKEMWTFDQFFNCVTDIISRKIFHIFYVNEGKEISLCIRPHKKLHDLKDEIFTHTQVCPSSQLLLFDKSLFLSQIDPLSDISKFPSTSLDNPLILVHMKNTDSKYLTPVEAFSSFPTFPTTLNNTEKDASVAETCCIKAYAVKRLLAKLVRCQELLFQIPKILISVSAEKVSKLSSDFEILKFKTDAVSHMFELLKKTISVVSPFISNNKENHDGTICNRISDRVTEERKSIDKIKKELAHLLPSLHVMKKQVVDSKIMKNDYEQILYKQPSLDKCVELASTLVEQICDSWQVFKRHRNMRVLCIQDQPFHMLQRVKVQNTSKKLLLLQSEALKIHTQTPDNLSDWYSGFQAVMTQCHCLETALPSINNSLARCSSSLLQLEPELFEIIKRITIDESYCVIFPNFNNSNHPKPVVNEHHESNEDQYKDISTKLDILKSTQQDIGKTIEENKRLLEKFNRCFQIQNEDNEKLQEDSADNLNPADV